MDATAMKIERFEDLLVWQRAQDLAVFIYATLTDLKDWKFKSQMADAAVSISNNIAEGSTNRPRSITSATCTSRKPPAMRSGPCPTSPCA